MADSEETAFFRGEGGAVFEMALPLPENQQYKLDRGQLKRCAPDGSDLTGDDAPAEPKRPAVGASKNEWVRWAVSQGATVDDADAMTKNDLVEKYGK
jgi:hypothetical protein